MSLSSRLNLQQQRAAMAAEGDEGDDAPASSSKRQPQPRVRRRARKRAGPPQLQFVTATDPSQFKDETTKRNVRSQAMIQYRYKSAEQKKKTKETGEAEPEPEPEPVPELEFGETPVVETASTAPRNAERTAPMLLNAGGFNPAHDALLAQWLDEPQQLQQYSTTSEAWWSTNPDDEYADPSWVPSTNALIRSQPTRYYEALTTIPLNAAAERVTEYEDTDRHDGVLLRILCAKVATYNSLGDGVDPFAVIPQFESPELNSIWLVRKCNRAFCSASTMVKWLPAMLSHPDILLSSTIMASTFMDMHAGHSGESKRTVLVKAESIKWINRRLRDPATQFEDSTLMIILHVLAGEMWNCNEKTLRIHQSGVARLIAERGGMECLGGNGAVAEVAAAVTYQVDIVCEATSLSLFYEWEPPPFAADDLKALPESPLFSPRKEFCTVIKDQQCSEFTYELLSDMRDLTELFIAHCARSETVLDDDSAADAARLGPSLLHYDARVAEIRAKLVSLPSAYTPGLPTTHDWVYEACRIAAIIFTAAIIMRVPLSVAAEPTRNVIVLDTISLGAPIHSERLFSTRLTSALYEVMERTDVGGIWGDMAGCFYWAAAVGAAAARTPVNIDTYQRPNSRSEAYATWVRRCLMMFATRAMIIIVFEHPIPIIMAQKKLLKVQELIGSGSSRRLVS